MVDAVVIAAMTAIKVMTTTAATSFWYNFIEGVVGN